MGRYIDWADIANRYPDVAKIGGSEAVSSYWLNYVEAEIDARLAVRFTTPFTPTAPDVIKDVIIDMTYYRMTMRQKGSEVLKNSIDERISGMIDGTLYISSGVTESTVAWSEQDKTGYHTSFGPDNEIDWVVSSSWVDDVEAKRGQY